MQTHKHFFSHIFSEKRFVFRSKADLQNDLNEYEKNDVASTSDSNNPTILDSDRKREAANRLDNIHAKAFDHILSYWNPDIAEERVVNKLGKDFAQDAKEELERSNSVALQNLGRAFTKKDAKFNLNQEKRDIIRERIDVLDARANALNERLERLQKVRKLSTQNARYFANKKAEWQKQKSVLLNILNKLNQDESERDLAAKVKEIEAIDHDIRTHIMSMIDLNNPEVIRDVLPHLDEALIANAAGDSAPFDSLVATIESLGSSGAITIEPGALRIMKEMAAAMRPDKKNAYGSAARRFYANLGKRRIEASTSTDTDKSLKELKNMPIGQRVQIGGEPFVVTSKREKSVIVREVGGSTAIRTAAIDTEGEENKTSKKKEFRVLLRDPSQPKKMKDRVRKISTKSIAGSAGLNDQAFHFDLI